MQIIILTYQRLNSLQRLCTSLQKAIGNNKADLLFSLEYGFDKNVEHFINEFEWENGNKELRYNDVKLGVHQHFLKCIFIAQEHESTLILEDDLYMASSFYPFLEFANLVSKKDNSIAAAGLYHKEFQQDSLYPFIPLNNGAASYKLQKTCSNGFWINKYKAIEFNKWYEQKGYIQISNCPAYIKKWGDEAWESLFTKFLIAKEYYTLYPRISFATDFGEKGVHYHNSEQKIAAQTNLHYSTNTINYSKENEIIPYDAWYEINADYLKSKVETLKGYQFQVDLLSNKEVNYLNSDYVLTSRNVKPGSSLLSFSTELIPLENNILQALEGDQIKLVKTEDIIDDGLIKKMIKEYDKQVYFKTKHSLVQGFKNAIAKQFKRWFS